MESNANLDRLPPHLRQFIKPQNYEDYTPIDQAVWRYVMRKNVSYLSRVAHESYLEGLEKTGISIEEIPSMYGMNRILQKIGWAAVAVDGFIPPNAFMEFQAYKVLVIASDIRQLENIQYTPAPDIIHEAAGHSPIIANPDYAEYLRRFGAIGAKAIGSAHDHELYEAVRRLSILKEAADATEEEIREAEEKVDELQNRKVVPSELAAIRNLHWWTVEYGLIGTVEDYRIYGAGLLSSIGESEWCMTDQVHKLPYSIDAAEQEFDITRPQPQLFVTPDFSYLMQVLEEFANTMALRRGGFRGVRKLIECRQVGTVELSTGLQISGRFSRCLTDEDNQVIWLQTEGPTAFAYREKELIGHGIEQHPNGICTPLGKLKGINLAIEDMSPIDLKAYNFYDGKWISFQFESGILVEGLNITGVRHTDGKLLLIEFENCTVTYGEEVLFRPSDGVFTLALGKEVVSAFAGAADHLSFPNLYHESETKTHRPAKSAARRQLEEHYGALRRYRQEGRGDQEFLATTFDRVQAAHPDEWLLPLEILELSRDEQLTGRLTDHLHELRERRPGLRKLIDDGLALIAAGPELVA